MLLSSFVIFGPAALGLFLSFVLVGEGNRLIWTAVLPALLLIQVAIIFIGSKLIGCTENCEGVAAIGIFLSWIPAWICVVAAVFFKRWRKSFSTEIKSDALKRASY
jgi:hypothetical protein